MRDGRSSARLRRAAGLLPAPPWPEHDHAAADLFVLLSGRPPRAPLFPYTTLFRSPLLLQHHRLQLWPDADGTQFRPSPGRRSFGIDRKSTRLNSSHVAISYAVFCLKKKTPTKLATNSSAGAARISCGVPTCATAAPRLVSGGLPACSPLPPGRSMTTLPPTCLSSCLADLPELHSFPTRRSSDLHCFCNTTACNFGQMLMGPSSGLLLVAGLLV